MIAGGCCRAVDEGRLEDAEALAEEVLQHGPGVWSPAGAAKNLQIYGGLHLALARQQDELAERHGGEHYVKALTAYERAVALYPPCWRTVCSTLPLQLRSVPQIDCCGVSVRAVSSAAALVNMTDCGVFPLSELTGTIAALSNNHMSLFFIFFL